MPGSVLRSRRSLRPRQAGLYPALPITISPISPPKLAACTPLRSLHGLSNPDSSPVATNPRIAGCHRIGGGVQGAHAERDNTCHADTGDLSYGAFGLATSRAWRFSRLRTTSMSSNTQPSALTKSATPAVQPIIRVFRLKRFVAMQHHRGTRLGIARSVAGRSPGELPLSLC